MVREHHADVWRYLRYLGAGAADADDLTQETFLAVARSRFEERSPAQTAGYLRTVARNQLLMARRRQGREVHTVEIASRHRQIPRPCRAGRQQQRIVTSEQVARILVYADLDTRDKLYPGIAQKVDAAIDQVLFQLHVRDAVHQQSADAISPLVDRDMVAGPVQLLRGC